MMTMMVRMLAANTLALMPRCRFQHFEHQCTRAATRIALDVPGQACGGLPWSDRVVCDAHADTWKRTYWDQSKHEYVEEGRVETKDLPDAKRVRELERIAWEK